ncbi:MAG: rod shape-determining protein RodA [Candidatus Omnitrophota bacterium]
MIRTARFRILIIAILISVIGILSIYSSNYQKEEKKWQSIYKRQIYWFILGLAFYFIMANLNYRRLLDATYFLYVSAVLLLLLVFILGAVRLGAQRWLRIAWFNFQPSEIVKLVMIIFLARYFSTKSSSSVTLTLKDSGILRALVIPFLFIAIPTALIIEQPDLGSGAIVLFIFMVMLYISGVKLKYISIIFLLGLLFIPILWHILRDYQKERLLVFLNPNIDPLGAGYTIIQSKIAIGSGGFLGKGWLSGTQGQLHFLPESHTDFIFATFAEEWGFLGAAVLLVLYYLLIKQGIGIAQKTSDNFARLLAFGISLMLVMQVFINIAMTIGLAPVVGLPLPLMSYGGSSTLVTYISLGILANIDKQRTVF